MYTPPSDNMKKKPNLAELFNSPEVQKAYAEQNADRPLYIKMEDVYDRPITVLSFEIVKEKSKFSGQEEEFCRIDFYFSDDESKLKQQCRTQSASLMRALLAIGNDRLREYDGVPTMISMKKEGAKTILSFDGIWS